MSLFAAATGECASAAVEEPSTSNLLRPRVLLEWCPWVSLALLPTRRGAGPHLMLQRLPEPSALLLLSEQQPLLAHLRT